MVEPNRSPIKRQLNDPFLELYISVATDYINRTTLATVLFFTCCPWAALFWPPYYSKVGDKN